jgi:hypothetical protein
LVYGLIAASFVALCSIAGWAWCHRGAALAKSQALAAEQAAATLRAQVSSLEAIRAHLETELREWQSRALELGTAADTRDVLRGLLSNGERQTPKLPDVSSSR